MATPSDAAISSPPHLYSHALESVFGFFSLKSLNVLLRVCHSWSSSIARMRSIGATVLPRSSTLIDDICHSRHLARHIFVLGAPAGEEVLVDSSTLRRIATTVTSLRTLHALVQIGTISPWSSFMPAYEDESVLQQIEEEQLNSEEYNEGNYDVQNNESDFPFVPLPFPRKLPLLSLRIMPGAEAKNINSTIASIATLPMLTSLSLRLPEFDPSITFASLCSAVDDGHLTHLELYWPGMEMTDEQIDEIRSLDGLQSMLFARPDASLLSRLLQQPTDQLKWHKMSEWIQLDDARCQLLSTLPSLTSLRGLMRHGDISFMHRLTRLEDVSLSWQNDHTQPGDLVAALKICVGIKELALNNCLLSSIDMCTLLPHLPNLKQLNLTSASQLDSLVCFSSGSVCHTLTHLTLFSSRHPQLHATEVQHIHALRELKSLRLVDSMREALSEVKVNALMNMPMMIDFKYSPPRL